MATKMNMAKRCGTTVVVDREKLLARIQRLAEPLDNVDVEKIVDKTLAGLYEGVKSTEIDVLASETSAYLSCDHPNYSSLAARISVSLLHKETKAVFSDVVDDLYNYVNPLSGLAGPLIADDVYEIIQNNKERLNAAVNYERDFLYDYFGFKTLCRSYLLLVDGKIAERPQQMLMRVSVGIHKQDIDAAIETYDLMSTHFFTHASPTLFNSGTPRNQMSSCFLLTMADDSIEGIYKTLTQCAMISKSAGGIGLSCHNIRASGSYIRGSNGTSNGLVPMLRVFNNTARYVDQGGGKRRGAFAIYLEPWHPDLFSFLDLKKNTGKDEQRARDLFFALWICDLFMKRVTEDGDWSFFCPNECPGLPDCWGEEFETLYTKYEASGKARKVSKARDVWLAIIEAQIETGTPYILYKDACNRKSNQQNLGTIKSSNLCTEIIEYSAPDEIAVCNLASIALPMYYNAETNTVDHQRLFDVTQVVTRNLNKIIDVNFYPLPETRKSNMRHRPIGIGVQGLADLFCKMGIPFASDAAKKVNKELFETIYFAALKTSNDLAKVEGPYETYAGSPVSKGVLQYDMWGVTPSDRWDWASLKTRIAEHGVRNSLLVAPMPTASTAQILGNNESIEPYTSNLYNRRVLSGEFTVVNKHLVRDLIKLEIWGPEMKNRIIANKGSVQGIETIPAHLRELYKTVWEISQRDLIDMAADRGAYIDQSQSFNVHMDPTFKKLSSMHLYGWKKGLKTGMYYLRSRPAADAIQFTVDQTALKKKVTVTEPKNVAANAVKSATPNKENLLMSPKRNSDASGGHGHPLTPSKKRNEPEKSIPEAAKEETAEEADPAKKRKLFEEGEVCRMEEGCLMCGS
eukprot:TRINITY_DN6052_c0_g1_i1.p1 TRINITY_DN6052_c0_g1~~TRINITY_DN6052_c0_g1_i1.p1  ORF type:complete len:926 (+),score=298.75 TRINITY_DN6052_c0_g1_i1:211-2778(+)